MSILLEILKLLISLLFAPIGILLAVIAFAKRRDPAEIEWVIVGSAAGGLGQFALVAYFREPGELLRLIIIGAIVGALLVISLEWIGYIVAAILHSLRWIIRRDGVTIQSRAFKLDLVIWGVVVGGLTTAVSNEANQGSATFLWALTAGGIIGAVVGALGEFLRR